MNENKLKPAPLKEAVRLLKDQNKDRGEPMPETGEIERPETVLIPLYDGPLYEPEKGV